MADDQTTNYFMTDNQRGALIDFLYGGLVTKIYRIDYRLRLPVYTTNEVANVNIVCVHDGQRTTVTITPDGKIFARKTIEISTW
jgi:hypothetical protein